MTLAFILMVAEALIRTYLLKRSTGKHGSKVRAKWSVYLRRWWHGGYETHRYGKDSQKTHIQKLLSEIYSRDGSQFATI